MFSGLRRGAGRTSVVWTSVASISLAWMSLQPVAAQAADTPVAEAPGGGPAPVAPVSAAAAPESAPAAPESGPAAAAPPGKMDFDLFQDEPAPQGLVAPDPKLELQLETRRSMLTTHQALGLTTLGVMAVTCVLGQLDYNDMYGSGAAGTGNYLWPKRIGAYTTTGLFLTTASFSLFAPKPFDNQSEGIDRITVHKIAVIAASLGMATQIGLGFVSARAADAGQQKSTLAATHMAVGWTTLAFMSTAALTWVF